MVVKKTKHCCCVNWTSGSWRMLHLQIYRTFSLLLHHFLSHYHPLFTFKGLYFKKHSVIRAIRSSISYWQSYLSIYFSFFLFFLNSIQKWFQEGIDAIVRLAEIHLGFDKACLNLLECLLNDWDSCVARVARF